MSDLVLEILRKNIVPHCHTAAGDLPMAEELEYWIEKGEGGYGEWTIDAMGARDWKLDRDRTGSFSVRYRGEDPKAHAAAAACNEELASPIID